MAFLGAFVYDIQTDENLMTAKSKTFKHVLKENETILRQSTPIQSQPQSLSASNQSQSVTLRRSQRISNQFQCQSHLVSQQRGQQQSKSVSCQRSKQISTQSHLVTHQSGQLVPSQSQSVSTRRGRRIRNPKRNSLFIYQSTD